MLNSRFSQANAAGQDSETAKRVGYSGLMLASRPHTVRFERVETSAACQNTVFGYLQEGEVLET